MRGVIIFGAGVLCTYWLLQSVRELNVSSSTGVAASATDAVGAGASNDAGATGEVVRSSENPREPRAASPGESRAVESPTASAVATGAGNDTRATGNAGTPGQADERRTPESVDAEGDDRAEATATNDPNTGPIPLMDGMTLRGDMREMHAALGRETRDVNWASVMEIQLLSYFAAKPALALNFSLPVVVCRQTGCEVQAVGYGPQAFDTWQKETADMSAQPWAGEFVNMSAFTLPLGPNVQGVVLILMRAAPGPHVQSVEPVGATS